MPAVVTAAKAIWTTWTAWAAQHAVAAFIIKTVVSIAATTAIGRALSPKLGGGSLTSGNPLQMTRDPAPPRSVIYGEIRKSGPMLDAFITGTDNAYLNFVVALAGHECEAIGSVWFNDTIEPLDAGGNSTGTYAGYARVKKKLGATGQAADSDFVADSAGQRAVSDKFDRTAYLYGRFKWNQDKWPGGFPALSALTKGRKCYDPRTATTAWTDNPALCVRDYLTNTDFGLAIDASEIDDASFIEAANICDEAVALAAGGTEKRYRCNGTFETTAEPASVLEKLVESMAGSIVYVGGKWICYAGAHRTPESSHLTEDDLRGTITVQTKASLRDTCNRVRGQFSSPDDKYQPADFTPIVNSLYLSEDLGVEIWRDLSFAFVTSHSQAQRLAKIELERTRQDITVQMPCKLTALRYKPGDVVPVDNAEQGWSGKLFIVTGAKFTPYTGDGQLQLGVDLQLRETAAEVWDWNSGEETTYDPAANTNLHDPRTVATMAGLTLNGAIGSDITALPRIRASWTLPSDQFVVSGGQTQLRYKKNADADWTIWNTIPGDQLVEFISDLQIGTTYNVSGRHKNSAGVWSAWCTAVNLVAPRGENFDNYVANLTNDLHGVACDAEGNALSGELGVGGRAFTDVAAWVGSTGLTAVNSGPGIGQFSISASLLAGTATFTKVDADTVRCDSLGTASAIIRIAVNMEGLLTVNLDFSLVRVTSGGIYYLATDVAAVNKSTGGVYTPTTVNFTALAKLLTTAPAAYAGRFIIATFNGTTWTDVYTSGVNESTKAYAVPAGITAIRCRLYQAGGTTTLLDEEIIPITADGATGATGATGPTGPAGSNGTDGASVLGKTSGVGNASSTTWVDCCSFTLTIAAGKTVVLNAAGSVLNATAAIRSVYMRLMRDSTQLGSDFIYGNLPASTGTAPMAMAAADTPGAGTYTYKVQVRGTAAGVDVYGYADTFVAF